MGYISDDTRKVTTHRLVEMKQRGEKISMLTSYVYPGTVHTLRHSIVV